MCYAEFYYLFYNALYSIRNVIDWRGLAMLVGRFALCFEQAAPYIPILHFATNNALSKASPSYQSILRISSKDENVLIKISSNKTSVTR